MTAEAYEIEYAEEAVQDVKRLRRIDQKKVLEGIENHLRYEPTKASRSRIKQMVQPFWSDYRLRVDEYRAYYDVDEETRTVSVLRILEKGQKTTKELDHEAD